MVLQMIKNWIKRRFSSLPDILVSAFLSSILATGGVSLFYKKLWLYLQNKLILPTPLWVTISLVFLALVGLKMINNRSYKNTNNSKTNKINIDDYEFIKDPGYYKHKINEGEFCSPCLVSIPPIASPLTEPNDGVWHCNKCNIFIYTKEAKRKSYDEIKRSNDSGTDSISKLQDDEFGNP